MPSEKISHDVPENHVGDKVLSVPLDPLHEERITPTSYPPVADFTLTIWVGLAALLPQSALHFAIIMQAVGLPQR